MMVVFMAAFLLMAPGILSIVNAAAEADIETMKNATVRIVTIQGGRYLGHGSGMVIDDGKHVVTNYHVIRAVEEQGAQAFIALGRGRDLLRSTVIRATSRANDIAVLAVDQKLAKPSVKFVRRDDVKQGEQVMAVGYPWTSDVMNEDWLNAPATPTPGQVVQLTRRTGGTHVIQITAPINPGNSGGPVFNSRGHVIGMSTFLLRDAAGAFFAVDSDEIMEVVKRTSAIFETAAPSGSVPGGSNEKPKDPNAGGSGGGTVTPPPPPPPPPAPEPWYTNPMVIGGGALVLLLAVVGIFMMSRNKAQAPPPQMQMPPQMQAPMPPPQHLPPTGPAPVQSKPTVAAVKRSSIVGVSGFFAGRTVELPAGRPMIIGRDPQQAQLVFPAEMSEISRVHCIVTFDPATQTFGLEDRSTNGTFMVNGQRVSGQIKLRSGERFYLGEATNLFEVRSD
jgi:S1-C subfamily serine protease